MVSQKYRGSCIGAALAKWLAKNTVAEPKNGFGGENGRWCIGDALMMINVAPLNDFLNLFLPF